MMNPRARLLLLALGLTACDAAETAVRATIPGAQYLTFRCIGTDGQGYPLAGCGCTERTVGEDGQESLRLMGRVECTCTRSATSDTGDVDLIAVAADTCEPIKDAAGCQTGWSCLPATDPESGDWVPVEGAADGPETAGEGSCPPVPAKPTTLSCQPQRNAWVRGYVGSAERGEVSLVDLALSDDKTIVDVDETIPGITAIFVDDLVTAVGAHPHGDMVFTLNATSGSVSVILDDLKIREAVRVDLAAGPLQSLTVWPSPQAPHPDLNEPARAYVTAPSEGAVLELDLDALLRVARCASAKLADCDPSTDGVILRAFALPEGARPGAVAVSADGQYLVVGQADKPVLTYFDRLTGASLATSALHKTRSCEDGYLVRVVEPKDDVTCQDGLDNDGDGATDQADPSCAEVGSEALDLTCPKRSECVDGADNDGDGLTDADDPDCAPCAEGPCVRDFEGTAPACANGQDDDEDGLIDRADPGCTHEADTEERDGLERSTCVDGLDNDGDGKADADDDGCLRAAVDALALPEEVAADAPCQNGRDDDGDGLTDAEDPGCNDIAAASRFAFEAPVGCSDGVDNDGDGLTDFGEDPDCYAASDKSEGSSAVAAGPRALLPTALTVDGQPRSLLYVLDVNGKLAMLDLATLPPTERVLSIDKPLMDAALRAQGDDQALLAIGTDAQLRSIALTAPVPLVTADGLPIFARAALDGSDTIDAFYVVKDGVAWALPDFATLAGLDESMALPSLDDDPLPYTVAVERAVIEDDPATRLPLDMVINRGASRDRGYYDPQVYARDLRTLANQELNLSSTAYGRVNQAQAPVVSARGSQLRYDTRRHPTFCQLPLPVDAALTQPSALPADDCVPVGYTADGQVESSSETLVRTSSLVGLSYEGIQLVEPDPEKIVPGTFTLAYEGELPRSQSRTGQLGERVSDDEWVLLDYEADYCRVGVEAGDVVLVDLFVPLDAAAGQDPACQALSPQSTDPTRLREPLRYLVAEVNQHRLRLVRDTRLSYAPQVARDDRTALPSLYPPPPAPPYRCAAQFVYYHVRAGQDAWLLSSDTGGYRHPWVAQSGQCVQDPNKVATGRVGRAKLGEPFANEWFRFTLGAFRHTQCGEDCMTNRGVPEGSSPHMLDVTYTFKVTAGLAYRRLLDVALLPASMHWLPVDDHLYVVDGAYETVVEVAGFDVFNQAMRIVRRLD